MTANDLESPVTTGDFTLEKTDRAVAARLGDRPQGAHRR